MTAEAMCPICGKTVLYCVKNIQTAPQSRICDECEEAERIAAEEIVEEDQSYVGR